jgi:hypothetical protein
MITSTSSPTAGASRQYVTLYFNDGNIQDAILQADLLQYNTIQFVPRLPDNDRRRHPRTPFLGEVRIDQLGVRRAADLSSRGMYVECMTPYPAGNIISICLDISGETFCLDARVAFADPGIGMGLEFDRIPSSAQLKLSALVQRTVRQLGTTAAMGRRRSVDRRAPEAAARKLKIRRHTPDRRRHVTTLATPLEIEHARLKTIFFQEELNMSHIKGIHARVEFHDGEEIHVRLLDDSPDAVGFFAEMKLFDDMSHTLYIVKLAVKHINHLL